MQVRGTIKPWRGDIPLAGPDHSRGWEGFCIECKTNHHYDSKSNHSLNALTFVRSHIPDKPRHVGSNEVFEVSVSMLRLGRGARELPNNRLDNRSLDLLRERAARSMRLLTRKSFALAQLRSQRILRNSTRPESGQIRSDIREVQSHGDDNQAVGRAANFQMTLAGHGGLASQAAKAGDVHRVGGGRDEKYQTNEQDNGMALAVAGEGDPGPTVDESKAWTPVLRRRRHQNIGRRSAR